MDYRYEIGDIIVSSTHEIAPEILDAANRMLTVKPPASECDPDEFAYWQFDARRKGYAEWRQRPQSERDAFKQEIRNAFERGFACVPADRAPLESVDARYKHLLNLLGVQGHDGAVSEITALRSHLVTQPKAAPVAEAPTAWLLEYEYLAGMEQQGSRLKVTKENWGKQSVLSQDLMELKEFSNGSGFRNVTIKPLFAAPATEQAKADLSGLTVWSLSPTLSVMVHDSPRQDGRKKYYLCADVEALLSVITKPAAQATLIAEDIGQIAVRLVNEKDEGADEEYFKGRLCGIGSLHAELLQWIERAAITKEHGQ